MRVLVTRPEPDARRTAARLADRGYEPVIAPASAIAATREAPPAGPFDALVLTSAHAVPALASLPIACAPLFAVGARTARAAREAGFTDVREAAGDAPALAALVSQALPPGARVLHPAGRDRKEEPERALRAAGIEVIAWEAYEARAQTAWPAEAVALLQAGRIDAALHFSRRSASLAVLLAESAGVARAFAGLVHLCLSADVAAALPGPGDRIRIAGAPSEDALLDALDRFAGGESPRVPA